jgi:hypothetical protein
VENQKNIGKEADDGPEAGNPGKKLTTKFPVLYVAFELGNSTWKLACSDGRKVRHVTVTARDLDQVELALLRAQNHFGMSEGCSTVSCY